MREYFTLEIRVNAEVTIRANYIVLIKSVFTHAISVYTQDVFRTEIILTINVKSPFVISINSKL